MTKDQICNPPCPLHLCAELSKVGMCQHGEALTSNQCNCQTVSDDYSDHRQSCPVWLVGRGERLSRENYRLRTALLDLYNGTAEYVYLNNLGDPHNTTPMQNAAEALGVAYPRSLGAKNRLGRPSDETSDQQIPPREGDNRDVSAERCRAASVPETSGRALADAERSSAFWKDESIAANTVIRGLSEMLIIADELCKAAVSFASDVGLHSDAYLWDKIEAYQNARAAVKASEHLPGCWKLQSPSGRGVCNCGAESETDV